MTLDEILEPPAENIGAYIRSERERMGLSQSYVSLVAGAKRITMFNVESSGSGNWRSIHACLRALRLCDEILKTQGRDALPVIEP